MVGCNQKSEDILLSDTWACPIGATLKIWKDGYPGEEKIYDAIGCRTLNGKRVGFHIAWKNYGIKEHEGGFIDDEPDGEWSYFHVNGNLHSRGFFIKGKRNGAWRFWDDSGKFLYERKYEHGEIVNKVQQGI